MKRSYPDLKAALIKNFDTALLQYDRESEFYDCKQRGRDLNIYITELEKLEGKLRVDSKELLNHLRAGLDEPFKTELKLKQPRTYEEAVSYLNIVESSHQQGITVMPYSKKSEKQ